MLLLQISAQESRRKKKEFVDTLEKQVEVAAAELGQYKSKCRLLERENATLLSQLKSLQKAIIVNNVADKVKVKVEVMEEAPDGLGLD